MDFSLEKISKIRAFRKPEDGLRAVMDRAPQAEKAAARAIESTRPVWSWIYEERRRLATACVVVLTGWLFLHVTFGSNGMVVYRQKKGRTPFLAIGSRGFASGKRSVRESDQGFKDRSESH